MIDIYGELKSIINTLAENNIEYAVCGGWAMAIYGVPRATTDIDLLISADSLEQVFDLARANGFRLENAPMSFHDGRIEVRSISKTDEETGFVLTLDLLLVTPEMIDVWQGKTVKPLENGTVSVVSREGLIKLKTLSGLMRDKADIEMLIGMENES
jgi:hypothetical protein